MSYPRIAAIFLIAIVGNPLTCAADDEPAAKTDPLFADNEIVEITIRAPLTTLMRDRPVDDDLPAQLRYSDAELGDITLDIGVRTRGRYRQQQSVCPFAPLRLNFKKDKKDESIFRKTDKIKLVTHCRDGSSRYSQGVLREYLAYRIFNTMTDKSFRVRLLRVTYVDTDALRPDSKDFAFLIEPRERLAKRLDMKALDIERTSVAALDRQHTNLGSVFQYLIGNTDFSPIQGGENEPCCHNYVLLSPDDGPLLSVPYDLDMSGLVNAPHALPNERFRLKNVRQRLYRGRCENNALLEQTLQAYQDRKKAIYGLLDGLAQLDASNRKKLARYIDAFYDTIGNPRRVESRLTKRCV